MNKKEWAEKMFKLASTMSPGEARAQAYNIGDKIKNMNSTIAQMMIDDHHGIDHSLRHSPLLIEAGLGKYEAHKNPNFFGVYTFIDGSKLDSGGAR